MISPFGIEHSSISKKDRREGTRTALAVGTGAAGLGAAQAGAFGGAAHVGHHYLKPAAAELAAAGPGSAEAADWAQAGTRALKTGRAVGLGTAGVLGGTALGANALRRRLRKPKAKVSKALTPGQQKRGDRRQRQGYAVIGGATGIGAAGAAHTGALSYKGAKQHSRKVASHLNVADNSMNNARAFTDGASAARDDAPIMRQLNLSNAKVHLGAADEYVHAAKKARFRSGVAGGAALGLAGAAGIAAHKRSKIKKDAKKHDITTGVAGTGAVGAAGLAGFKYKKSKTPYGPEIRAGIQESRRHTKAGNKHLKMPKLDTRPGAVNKPLSEAQLQGKKTNAAHRFGQAAEAKENYKGLAATHKAGNLKALRIGHGASAAGVGLAGLAGAAALTRNRKSS